MTAAPPEELARLEDSLRRHDVRGAELAFVLGSGLGAFADQLTEAREIPYDELDGMPQSGVKGHAGRLVVGRVGRVRVIVQQGRVHLYEGWRPSEVTRAVRAFARVGVRGLVLTNAAGGLVPSWPPGTLMRITDHLNRQGALLEPGEAGRGSPYDGELGLALEDAASEAGVELERGVYAALPGPSYETPAEVRMLRWMGADAVGMSTAAEAAAAWACGLRVAGVSLVTNAAAGLTGAPLSHDEVVEAGRAAAGKFCAVLERSVRHLVRALP